MNAHRRRLLWQLRLIFVAVGGLGTACYVAGDLAGRGFWLAAYLATAALSAWSIKRLPRLPLWGEGTLAVILWATIGLEWWRTGDAFLAASNMLAVVQGLLAPRADGKWHRVAVGAGLGAHLVAATVLPIDVTGQALVAICLLGLVVAGGRLLRLWHLERVADAWSDSGSVTASEAIRAEGAGRGGWLGALGVAAVAALFAAVAFVAIPRPGEAGGLRDDSGTSPLPSLPGGPRPPRGKAVLTGHGGRRRTGFHDRVDFSNLGPIKRDPRVALRVQTLDIATGRPAELGGPLRLRGAAFNRYANRAWSSAGVTLQTLRDADDNETGRRDGRVAIAAPRRGAPVWQQDIERMQLTAPYLFHTGKLLAAAVPELLLDGNGTAALTTEPPAQVRVWSSPSRPDPKTLVRDTVRATPAFAAPIWTERRRVALLERVAREVAGGERDPYRFAKRIEMGLRRRYKYTLDVPRPPKQREPLTLFLEGAHAGHCEYFATAMVLLLRTRGVPCRLVVGYRSSEHDPATGITTIRHAHAHAWVEVRFAASGWVPFDPTPADSTATDGDTIPSPQSPAAGGAELGGLEDAAAGPAWFETLMEFDEAERMAVLEQVGGLAGLLVALALALLVVWLAWRGWRRYGRRPAGAAARHAPPPPRAPPDFYRTLLRVLGRAGFVRRAAMTPRELALWVRSGGGPAPDAVDKITVTFERLRFGGGGRVTGETARKLRELVEKVATEAEGTRL
ncbi:MAG: DUF4129 domain-containing transglutaminase family protein [Planctomycetota bacterium]|jgi:transglutaminase-like putative cysteine protease